MIEVFYAWGWEPYPWGWRIHLVDGTVHIGVGIPNKFETPKEACEKAKWVIKTYPELFEGRHYGR